MIAISDEDYKKVVRLLKSFAKTEAVCLREHEERRQARLLLRKWEKREKRRLSALKKKDNKLY